MNPMGVAERSSSITLLTVTSPMLTVFIACLLRSVQPAWCAWHRPPGPGPPGRPRHEPRAQREGARAGESEEHALASPSEQARDERAKEDRRVDTHPIVSHPPAELGSRRVIPDHAEGQHPAGETQA